MNAEDPRLDAILSDLIDADVPRAELSTAVFGLAGKAAQPVVEKGLKKLTERTLEAEILQATAGEVDDGGARRLGWKILIRNHTAVAFAVETIAVAVGRDAAVSSTTGLGMAMAQPDDLSGRLMICAGEGHCEFWLHTVVGRGRKTIPVTISLSAMEGDRKHELQLRLNRSDDLALKVRQAP